MEVNELGAVLHKMYFNSAKSEAVAMIHLFEICYATDIKASGSSAAAIATAAGIPKSYGTEIYKGIRLSEFVTPKEEAAARLEA